jgi:hypothetical protein
MKTATNTIKKTAKNSTDIGSPKVPVKPHQTKQQQENLKDWAHAS